MNYTKPQAINIFAPRYYTLKNTMGFFKFVFSKAFLKHFVLAFALGVLLLLSVYWWLDFYTRHGEDIVVPNYSVTKMTELEETFKGSDLNYVVIDSVYEPKIPKGVVIDQNPDADAKVKEGRTIYLTINAINPPSLPMPDLVDLTLRQAIAKLEDYGFKLGNKQYVPDIAKDAVLGQKSQGKEIKAGEMLPKGSRIDLVLGDGLKNNKVYIPYVINMTLAEAEEAINAASLDMGVSIHDKTVLTQEDSLQAKVYRQNPVFNPRARVTIGQPLDIFLTMDTAKIKVDMNAKMLADSIKNAPAVPDNNAPE